MSLFKRGNVFWSYVWISGIRHAKSTGTANRRIAEQIDQKHAEELNLREQRVPQFDPEMSFEDLYARFLANGSPKPYHLERGKQLLPFLSEVAIGRINRNTALEYRKLRHKEKPLTDATINRDIGCLRNILYWAVDEGILAANPLSRARLVREPRKRRPILSAFDEELLKVEAAPHLRLVIEIALSTGMRRGEILNQRFEDVDFARRLLFVSKSKTPEGEAREIPLTARLFQLLWESRENDGLIVTYKGQSITAISKAWKSAIRRSGIRYCRFHDLRHTFNTRLMEAGVMQEVRKALMGHSSGEDVHATYTHVELPAKRTAIRKLETWLSSQLQLDSHGQPETQAPQPESPEERSNGIFGNHD